MLRPRAHHAICCASSEPREGAKANSMASQVGTDLAKPYEPTADERAAVVAHLARRKQKPPSSKDQALRQR